MNKFQKVAGIAAIGFSVATTGCSTTGSAPSLGSTLGNAAKNVLKAAKAGGQDVIKNVQDRHTRNQIATKQQWLINNSCLPANSNDGIWGERSEKALEIFNTDNGTAFTFETFTKAAAEKGTFCSEVAPRTPKAPAPAAQ